MLLTPCHVPHDNTTRKTPQMIRQTTFRPFALLLALSAGTASAALPIDAPFAKEATQCSYVMLVLADANQDTTVKKAYTDVAEILIEAATSASGKNSALMMSWQTEGENNLQKGGDEQFQKRVETCRAFVQDQHEKLGKYAED
jgi:hypothetical protein